MAPMKELWSGHPLNSISLLTGIQTVKDQRKSLSNESLHYLVAVLIEQTVTKGLNDTTSFRIFLNEVYSAALESFENFIPPLVSSTGSKYQVTFLYKDRTVSLTYISCSRYVLYIDDDQGRSEVSKFPCFPYGYFKVCLKWLEGKKEPNYFPYYYYEVDQAKETQELVDYLQAVKDKKDLQFLKKNKNAQSLIDKASANYYIQIWDSVPRLSTKGSAFLAEHQASEEA